MGVDDELVVPVAPVGGGDNPLRYTPRRGDTLVTVADRFNVSVEDLRRWNNLSSGTLRVGHAMYVAEPVRLAPSQRTRGRGGKTGAHAAAHGGAGKSASKGSRSPAPRTKKTAAKSKRTR
jgi:membrane-bound lytic murein transglycosylase D